MCTQLLGTAQWAQMEFGSVQLGDARRSRRLVAVATALGSCPSGTLPQALPQWADLKAAYRLFSEEEVSCERVMTPHWQRTRQMCAQAGEYLLIEDTTVLDFTNRQKARGFGWVGDEWSLGLFLHTTLAVRVEAWDLEQSPEVNVVGLFAQHSWVREHAPRKGKESRRALLQRPRESQRWARALEEVSPPPAEATWIYVADRESDIYEVFARCASRGIDYVVRASRVRALHQSDQTVFSTVAAAPVLGRMQLPLRAREGVAAREATLEVRSLSVTLRGTWRPGGKLPPLTLNVVEAREVGAPAGQEPIHWVLLTSLPCQRFVEARRIIARYARRWLVEEYHKALKSGAHVEASQLETRARVEALLGILAVVAIRLLQTKLLARSRPDDVINAETFGREAVEILSARFGTPKGGWTNATLLVAIARMGGFLARKGDGSPGWLTIWRGWQRLMIMVDGVNSLSFENRR
jgi:Transposase DNA-binding/Transposase DDE domain